MPKGYWIGHGDLKDPQAYAKYQAANAAPFAKYGARFLVRGGQQEVVEGASRSRAVVLEFPTIEAARACYCDPEYLAAKALRVGASDLDLVIVEGYDP